jgi:hypothetical protein
VYPGRTVGAVLISVVVVPVGIWAALVALLSLAQQVLAGFMAVGHESWTRALNPQTWLGWQNGAGTGGVLDSLLGGPGAPTGTVSRYLTFMLSALLAAGCYLLLTTAWSRANGPSRSASRRA